MIDVKVEGIRELNEKLRKLAAKDQKKLLSKVMRKPMRIMTKELKATAPVNSGLLSKSIANKLVIRMGVSFGIIGANAKKSFMVRGRKKIPGKYNHLADRGRGVVRPKLFRGALYLDFYPKKPPIAKYWKPVRAARGSFYVEKAVAKNKEIMRTALIEEMNRVIRL